MRSCCSGWSRWRRHSTGSEMTMGCAMWKKVSLKEGVIVAGASPEILLAILIAAPIFSKHGSELVITSLVDGAHAPTSRHYIGMAVDFRIWYLGDKVELAAQELREALGPDYYVRVETTHIHVSYKPRR